MPTVDLTLRLARESRPGHKDTFLFDKTLPGFGLRIHPSGRKVYIVRARIQGRSRRIVIARHGEMELAEARRRARDMLGRIRAGGNPAEDIRREKETLTFREFAEEYLRRCEPTWKPSGRKTMRIYLKARILPAFGRMPIDRIGPEDVAAWFDATSRERPGARDPDAFLFPRHAGGRGEWSLTNCWRTVCADAGLGRLRMHDLRHTVASQAVMAGENLPLVGRLLGHRRHRTTAGYAHLADGHLVEAAEKVGGIIAEAMEGDETHLTI